MALCLAVPGTAYAACTPDPTPANGTVTCTGVDADGLTITTNQTTVNVQQGATVSSMTATAIGNAAQFSPTFSSTTINDNGQITGGLSVHSGSPASSAGFGTSNTVTLTVAPTGSITGATAIALFLDPGASFPGSATINIDNSGTILSTTGGTFSSNDPNRAGVGTLVNQASGTIGPINVLVASLDNRGTIQGGATSAIRYVTNTPGSNFNPFRLTNSGTITSTATVPTIDLQSSFQTGPSVDNSGSITNTGTGSAVSFQAALITLNKFINNNAGATISSAGGTAITATGSLGITNAGTISGSGTAISTTSSLQLSGAGTINGAVFAGDGDGQGSTIDLTSGGRINGNLTLGGGNDTVLVNYAAGATGIAGVSGTVDAGGGFDRLVYRLTGNTTLDSLNKAPTFEATGLRLASGSTVTLSASFNGTSSLDLSLDPGGFATLINQGTITAAGPAISNSAFTFGTVNIQNSGSITANLANASDSAIQGFGQGTLANTGTITANGGNGLSVFGMFTNSGTITATNKAVAASNGLVTNSGTITSTAGTGLSLSGSTGTSATNTGTISGATIGVDLNGYTLTNSGTITASSGLGIRLNFSGSLVNQAGGVINGGVGVATNGFTTGSTVNNAGTINGNVNFGSGFPFASSNTFIALDGGVVNGDINLGSGGDRFVTSLVNTGSGAYAGLTGKVTGGPNETLIYRVDADTSATLAAPNSTFSKVVYDLANNAKLTLASATASTAAQGFSGSGIVNLTADINGTGAQPLIDLTQFSPRAGSNNAIALTSNGKISATNTSTSNSFNGFVQLGASSSFTNTGAITANDTSNRPSFNFPLAAISDFGGTVTNSGTLALGGLIGISVSPFFNGISDRPAITNSGSITQIAGAADAIGVSGVFALTNTGTIATGGTAVQFNTNLSSNGWSVVNSGTISSSHAPAIADVTGFFQFSSPPKSIVNQAGGTITGGTGQPAILLKTGNSVVDNAGTINGDVTFGPATSPFAFFTPQGSTYIARGGTLNGNLTFGAGNDTLIVVGNSIGVTGKIDAGAGINTYAQLFTASTTVDASPQTLPSTFQTYAIGASGAGTTLTITGPVGGLNAPLSLFGDGTVDLKANVNAATSPQASSNAVALGQYNGALGMTSGLTFINEATLADGVYGVVSSFTNNGSIGTTTLASPAVQLSTMSDAAFSFNNSGQIAATSQSAYSYYSTAVTISDGGSASPTGATIANTGTILGGGVTAYTSANSVTFSNSGTIGSPVRSDGFVPLGVVIQDIPTASDGSTPANSTVGFANTAAGTINGFNSVVTTAATVTVTNAGTINGDLDANQFSPSVYVPNADGSCCGTYKQTDRLTASLSNSGTINGGAGLSSSATTVTVTNSGTISGASFNEPGGLLAWVQTSAGNSLTMSNSGSITNASTAGSGVTASSFAGTAATTSATASISIVNTGSISSSGGAVYSGCCYYDYTTSSYIPVLSVAAGLSAIATGFETSSVTITNAAGATISATGTTSATASFFDNGTLPAAFANAGNIGIIAKGASVTISNSGTISGKADLAPDAGAVLNFGLRFQPQQPGPLAGGVQVYADTATLANTTTGTINGSVALTTTISAALTNYGTINGNVTLGVGDDTMLQGIGATLTGTADGGAGSDTLTIDLTGGGKLDAQLAHFTNFESTHLIGSGTVTSTTALGAGTLVLDNAALTVASGSTLQTAGAVTLTGGAGSNSITNYGTIAGKVTLGAGNDSFVEAISASTGAVDGGAGTNKLTVDVTGGGSLTQALAPFANFQSTALTGTGTITVSAPVTALTLVLNGATLTLANGSTLQTGGAVALTGGSGTNSFTNRGTVNGAIVGIDTLNAAGGTINSGATASTTAKFTNGAADATLNINAGTLTLGQKLVNSGLVAVAGGATLIDLAGISNLVGGRITIAKGGTIVDAVDNAGTIINNGTYTADLNNLTGGSATNATGATWTGTLTNAAGAALINQGTVTGTVANAGTFNNASGATLSGALTQSAGSTTNAGTLAGGAVISGGSLSSSGTINGLSNAGTATITGGTLSGTITNSGVLTLAGAATVTGRLTNLAGGQLAGTLAFGSGNDTLTLMSGAGVTGAVDGGAGTDTLVITSIGTDATPDEYNLTRITGFEQTTQTSGTIAVSGTYATTQLDIQAGRYIGRIGSVLNAGTVNLASGATFGSGGTVNGNISVKGTLAPGGTVGTMTVNGNVSFASGSTALFDVGQAASDQLAVSGAITIASGTTLSLAAVQNNPLKPGSSIDLIVANGGITGSFTTINKPASILGFVVQRATRISLLGQFLADGSFSVPATSAVNYVNSLLTGGQASAALLNAIPGLLTSGGNTNAAAFAQLTPEAYASATQIGTDNGLAVAGAMRHMEAVRAPDGGGLFVFAQGLGVWSRLNGNAGLGTSRASQNGGGVLGGIGFGSETASISAFVGYINARQTIAALGSRTTSNGIVAGASAHLASGGLSGTATFAYDASSADTKRPVPGGVSEASHYRLRSTTFAIDVGYNLPISKSWQVRPQVGFTSVRTKRGTAVETGSNGAFDFTVSRASQTANFIDGGVRIEAAPTSTKMFQPWLDLGVRHLLDADTRFATAFLAGGPLGITVPGAARARTVATVGAGFNASVARNVKLFAGYNGAFGTGTSGNKVNGGIKVSF